MKLLVVFEDAGPNYAAYVPDLPGCVSTGASREEVASNIREAIALHLAGMRMDGEAFPELVETRADLVEIIEDDIERAAGAFVG